MINLMQSGNFKCFSTLPLKLGRLTLLTGFNAGGKSSSFQGALMLSAALREGGRSAYIALNNARVRLGTAGDVLHQAEGYEGLEPANMVTFKFRDEAGFMLEWQLKPSGSGVPYVFDLCGVVAGDPNHGPLDTITDLAALERLLPLALRNGSTQAIASTLADLMYVSVNRRRDGDLFPMPGSGIPKAKDVGIAGEYAAWYLATFMEDVDEGRCHPDERAQTLGRQINAWGQDLFSGFAVNSSAVERTGLYRLEFKTSSTKEWRSPDNVGYGLGYAFPILTAGLIADRNQLLIVDSPEAHLHPRAQSKMGSFLAKAARSGPQIVAETHSDHVLNGVRLAVKTGLLASDDVMIHFFQNGIAGDERVISASIDAKGRLSRWPAGFFDQIESDLSKL